MSWVRSPLAAPIKNPETPHIPSSAIVDWCRRHLLGAFTMQQPCPCIGFPDPFLSVSTPVGQAARSAGLEVSEESSSRLLPFVSGSRKTVKSRPAPLAAAAAVSAAGKPFQCMRYGKRKTPKNPPILPTAAATPCAVVRTRTGKISDGYTKVVAFGPNSVKKKLVP